MLTQEHLKELLHYDPDTGIFTNLTQRANAVKIGSVAGAKKPSGYIYISVDNKLYRLHRLDWLYVYGEFPEKSLDHINEIKDDNSIINLRLATRQENAQNISSPQLNNTSGFRGVSWNKGVKKWTAAININGRKKHLGVFDTAEEAHECYVKFKKQNHPFWIPINKASEES